MNRASTSIAQGFSTSFRKIYAPQLYGNLYFEASFLKELKKSQVLTEETKKDWGKIGSKNAASEKILTDVVIFRPKGKGFFNKQKQIGTEEDLKQLNLPSFPIKTVTQAGERIEYFHRYFNSNSGYQFRIDTNQNKNKIIDVTKLEAVLGDFSESDDFSENFYKKKLIKLLDDPENSKTCYLLIEYKLINRICFYITKINVEGRQPIGKQLIIKASWKLRTVEYKIIPGQKLLVKHVKRIDFYSLKTGGLLKSVRHEFHEEDFFSFGRNSVFFSRTQRTIFMLDKDKLQMFQVKKQVTDRSKYPLNGCEGVDEKRRSLRNFEEGDLLVDFCEKYSAFKNFGQAPKFGHF